MGNLPEDNINLEIAPHSTGHFKIILWSIGILLILVVGSLYLYFKYENRIAIPQADAQTVVSGFTKQLRSEGFKARPERPYPGAMWWVNTDGLAIISSSSPYFSFNMQDKINALGEIEGIDQTIFTTTDYMNKQGFILQASQSFNDGYEATTAYYNSDLKLRCRFQTEDMNAGVGEEGSDYVGGFGCVDDRSFMEDYQSQAPYLRVDAQASSQENAPVERIRFLEKINPGECAANPSLLSVCIGGFGFAGCEYMQRNSAGELSMFHLQGYPAGQYCQVNNGKNSNPTH